MLVILKADTGGSKFAWPKRSANSFRKRQIEIREGETVSAQEPRSRGLFSRLKASCFTAGLSMGAMRKLKPVSNGLFFKLQPRRQIIPDETDWVEFGA
jgi:hypothetical protein